MTRTRILRDRTSCTFIVTTKSGQAFRGVLFDHDKRCLVLRNTEALDGQSGPIPIDGELLLLWDDVAFMNRP
jgi:hypothetical protein